VEVKLHILSISALGGNDWKSFTQFSVYHKTQLSQPKEIIYVNVGLCDRKHMYTEWNV